mgnify:FL=1|jgi:hypothetical protein
MFMDTGMHLPALSVVDHKLSGHGEASAILETVSMFSNMFKRWFRICI